MDKWLESKLYEEVSRKYKDLKPMHWWVNGDDGFEIIHRGDRHIIFWGRRVCTCKAREQYIMTKKIPSNLFKTGIIEILTLTAISFLCNQLKVNSFGEWMSMNQLILLHTRSNLSDQGKIELRVEISLKR